MYDPARSQSATDFEQVYKRGFFRKVLSLLLGRSDQMHLLSFDEVREKIRCHDESYTGLRSVPVDAIVGSVGRFKDFDREFLPVVRKNRERWRSIDEAYYRDAVLPPVELYKVGDAYFVKDGNHRVSVAKERGIAYLDAEVIETRCKVPLPADINAEDLEEAGARAFFLEWSMLDQLRPEQGIRVSVPGGYHELEEHINIHRYYLSQEQKREVPLWEAVASWYDNVYQPVVRLIHEDKALAAFPTRTEGDLYLWTMDHLNELRLRYGDDVDTGEAMVDFVEQHTKSSVLQAMRQRVKALLPGKTTERKETPS